MIGKKYGKNARDRAAYAKKNEERNKLKKSPFCVRAGTTWSLSIPTFRLVSGLMVNRHRYNSDLLGDTDTSM